jgi:hypothetical protein
VDPVTGDLGTITGEGGAESSEEEAVEGTLIAGGAMVAAETSTQKKEYTTLERLERRWLART